TCFRKGYGFANKREDFRRAVPWDDDALIVRCVDLRSRRHWRNLRCQRERARTHLTHNSLHTVTAHIRVITRLKSAMQVNIRIQLCRRVKWFDARFPNGMVGCGRPERLSIVAKGSRPAAGVF